jgi:hypothetical protein
VNAEQQKFSSCGVAGIVEASIVDASGITWCCGHPREISGRREPCLRGSVVFSGDTAKHVYEVLGAGASDHDVMRHAIDRRPVIITTDTDFDPLLGLALSNGDEPSLWRMFPHCRAAVGAPP